MVCISQKSRSMAFYSTVNGIYNCKLINCVDIVSKNEIADTGLKN
jgi:hypothetical protein